MYYDKSKFKEQRFCIYLHIRPDKNQVFYVGVGVKKRPNQRFNRSRVWKSIVAKNNENLIIDILCENQSWESVCQMEIALIKFYGRKDNGTGILCNMTDGGDGITGYVFTDESKEKIGNANRGRSTKSPEMIEKQRQFMMGNTLRSGSKPSREVIEKIRKSMTGQKRSKQAAANMTIGQLRKNGFIIEQVCLMTNIVLNQYIGVMEAKRASRVSLGRIYKSYNELIKDAKLGDSYWRRVYNPERLEELLAIHYTTYYAPPVPDLSHRSKHLAVA